MLYNGWCEAPLPAPYETKVRNPRNQRKHVRVLFRNIVHHARRAWSVFEKNATGFSLMLVRAAQNQSKSNH